MKYELSSKPNNIKEAWSGQLQKFSWMEFVSSIPQAISIITTWKEGQIPNACLQAWTMYNGDGDGYYVIFSILDDNHTYKNILRDKDFVFNFPDIDLFPKCIKTYQHYSNEIDEITTSGLTIEPSKVVNAPRIKECFLNLECRLEWHKPLHDGSQWHLFAGEVVHVAIENSHSQSGIYKRYGSSGFIYNIHSPTDPETGTQDDGMVGIVEPVLRHE